MSSIGRNLAETKKQEEPALASYMASKISNVLTGKKREAFVSAVVSAVQHTKNLADCSRLSIVSAALQGLALELSPSPVLGHFYMVPYKGKDGTYSAQFQLGYKGYIQLAIRSGQYRRINVLEIREGELLGWNPFAEKISVEIIEDDEKREKLPVVGYYAMFELVNGFEKSVYWSKKKMEQHADRYSPAFSLESLKKIQEGKVPKSEMWKYSSFWYADFDQMAFKTLLRHLISKWGVMSTEMQSAIEKDMTIIDENGTLQYEDNDLIDLPDGSVSDVEKDPDPKDEPEPSPKDSFFE